MGRFPPPQPSSPDDENHRPSVRPAFRQDRRPRRRGAAARPVGGTAQPDRHLRRPDAAGEARPVRGRPPVPRFAAGTVPGDPGQSRPAAGLAAGLAHDPAVGALQPVRDLRPGAGLCRPAHDRAGREYRPRPALEGGQHLAAPDRAGGRTAGALRAQHVQGGARTIRSCRRRTRRKPGWSGVRAGRCAPSSRSASTCCWPATCTGPIRATSSRTTP